MRKKVIESFASFYIKIFGNKNTSNIGIFQIDKKDIS